MERLVEIERRIVVEAGGGVVDHRVGGGQALVEGEAVDERLQGRAGRAQRGGHVHPAAGAVQSRRADQRPHRPSMDVDHHQGRGGLRPLGLHRIGRESLQPALQRGVEGRDDGGLVGAGMAGQFARDLPGQGREGRTAGERFCRRLAGVERAQQAGMHHPLQHPGAGAGGDLGMAVGPAGLGRLGQGDQQRLFAGRQGLGLMAEIGERGGADAFEIAAIGGQGQVGRQDLGLGEPRLDLQGARHLDQLGAQGAPPGLQQAGGLHGQGRGAGGHPPVRGQRSHRPAHRQAVDAQVIGEPRILQRHQPPQEAGIGPLQVRPDPPAAPLHGQGPQPAAVMVEHHGRGVLRAGEVGREDGVDGDGGQFQRHQRQKADDHPPLPPRGGEVGRGGPR